MSPFAVLRATAVKCMHAMVPLNFKLTCNRYTAEDEAQSFRDLLCMWEPLASVLGPIPTLNGNGDARRTMLCQGPSPAIGHLPLQWC